MSDRVSSMAGAKALPKNSRGRPGITLIELLIFIVILGLVAFLLPPLIISTMSNRLLQQTEALVEQSGMQTLQSLALRIRQGERILSPAPGETASVLAIQTQSGATNPTIIGTLSGTLFLIRRTTKVELSSRQVAMENFLVQNTSVSADRQSVHLSFQVSRTIRMHQPKTYRQAFQQSVNLFPDDRASSDACGCIPPYCAGNNTFEWRVCNGTCETATATLLCP